MKARGFYMLASMNTEGIGIFLSESEGVVSIVNNPKI